MHEEARVYSVEVGRLHGASNMQVSHGCCRGREGAIKKEKRKTKRRRRRRGRKKKVKGKEREEERR